MDRGWVSLVNHFLLLCCFDLDVRGFLQVDYICLVHKQIFCIKFSYAFSIRFLVFMRYSFRTQLFWLRYFSFVLFTGLFVSKRWIFILAQWNLFRLLPFFKTITLS
jgi:hypothetical protein